MGVQNAASDYLACNEDAEKRYSVLRLLPGESDEIIVGAHTYSNTDRFTTNIQPYRLNTRTLRLTEILHGPSPDNAIKWQFDADGQPRVLVAESENHRRIYFREVGSNDWKKIADYKLHENSVLYPAVFGYDGTLYVTDRLGSDKIALYRYDTAAQKIDPQPIMKVDGFDFNGHFEVDNRAKKLLGIHYETDARSTVWFDPAFRAYQAKIDALLPNTTNEVTCGNCSESPMLMVTASSDRQPPTFYLFDTRSAQLAAIGSAYPRIDPNQMGTRDFVRFKSRDGLLIPMYVTRPPGNPQGPQPTIIWVHAGPWTRGASWEWENAVQFLASRGYVVLQPQFRGTTGFGHELFEAGFKQWGLKMEDDLVDSAQWAVTQGYADPKRIGIMGPAYGGYATLMGLIQHPDLFRAGVDWIGMTDIDMMFSVAYQDSSEEAQNYQLKELIGDTVADADQFKATSPLVNAARMKQPLLMAYGSEDPYVALVQGHRFYDAVNSTNSHVEWIAYPEERHGWRLEGDKMDFWKRVDRFLDANLKSAPTQ